MYVDKECDICKDDNALLYHLISKLFADIKSYVHVKQRKSNMIKWCFLTPLSNFWALMSLYHHRSRKKGLKGGC